MRASAAKRRGNEARSVGLNSLGADFGPLAKAFEIFSTEPRTRQPFVKHFRGPNARENDCYSRLVASKSGRSRHVGCVTMLMADGSVHFVTDSIDVTTWRLLGSIADHEVVPEF